MITQNRIDQFRAMINQDNNTMSSRDLHLFVHEATGKFEQHDNFLKKVKEVITGTKTPTDTQISESFKMNVTRRGNNQIEYFNLDEIECNMILAAIDVSHLRLMAEVFVAVKNHIKTPQLPQSYLEAVKALAIEIEAKEEALRKIEFDKPKVTYATAVSGTNNPVSLREWINSLKSDQGLGVGERKVIKYLVESGILYRTKDGKLKAYAKHDKQFSLIPIVFATPDGNRETFQLKITGLGQLEVSQQVLKHFKEK